jgi:hypothetical protein
VNQLEIKEEEWKEWRHHPVTQAFHKFLVRARLSLMEQWAAKNFMGGGKEEVHILNAAALGELQAYENLLELDYERFKETMTDEQDQQ